MMSYLTFGAADLGCLSQLFFQNTSALLGVLIAIFNMTAFGVPIDVITTVSAAVCIHTTRDLAVFSWAKSCAAAMQAANTFVASVYV